jgi:hypothetical protein
LKKKSTSLKKTQVATGVQALVVQLAHQVQQVRREIRAKKEKQVNKVSRASKVQLAIQDLRVRLALKDLWALMDLMDLMEQPEPMVLRASKAMPEQQGLKGIRATRDPWVTWDPLGQKVISVLLDQQVRMERRERRAKWVLRVLWVRLALKVYKALKAILGIKD